MSDRNGIALCITFRHEIDLWPIIEKSILWQSVAPELVVLGYDEVTPLSDVPDMTKLMKYTSCALITECSDVLKVSGYRKGMILNKIISTVYPKYFVFTDGDCILNPLLIETYRDIFAGKLTNWDYIASDLKKYHLDIKVKYAKKKLSAFVFVGPNTYIDDSDDGLDLYNSTWNEIQLAQKIQMYGQRGVNIDHHLNLRDLAAMHGGNFGGVYSAIKHIPFSPAGLPGLPGTEDQLWANKMEGYRYTFLPTPETASVVHIGQDSKGRGLE